MSISDKCLQCGEPVEKHRGALEAHYRELHPEYQFSIVRNPESGHRRIKCVCGSEVSCINQLVKRHHIHLAPASQITDQPGPPVLKITDSFFNGSFFEGVFALRDKCQTLTVQLEKTQTTLRDRDAYVALLETTNEQLSQTVKTLTAANESLKKDSESLKIYRQRCEHYATKITELETALSFKDIPLPGGPAKAEETAAEKAALVAAS